MLQGAEWAWKTLREESGVVESLSSSERADRALPESRAWISDQGVFWACLADGMRSRTCFGRLDVRVKERLCPRCGFLQATALEGVSYAKR